MSASGTGGEIVRIDITDLPPNLRAQAERQIRAQEQTGQKKPEPPPVPAGNRRKFGNIPAERAPAAGGRIHFDSQKEARRYDELIMRLRAGQIHDLRLQTEFTLQEAYTDIDGHRIRAIRYRADFTYRERDGRLIVEDVKSRATRTKEYMIKRKLMKERMGIDITEV